MSKRKRASKTSATPASSPAGDEANDDAAAKDDMVHVTSDLLAGSPDIFAGKRAGREASPAAEPEASATSEAPEAIAEPFAPEPEPEPVVEAEPERETRVQSEPAEASTALSPEAPQPLDSEPAPSSPPPFVNAEPYPPVKPRRGGSGAALGIVLVVVGIFALLVAMSGVDLTQSGWPLFIIIPGLTLIVVGFIRIGAVATIPGGIVTMLGVVLAYTNSSGDWPFWAYGWSLVVPFGIGLGAYLQAMRDHDQNALRTGRTLLAVGLMIFLIGFVLFESILGISGRDYFGPVGKAALPLLLIIVGVILFVRSVQRSRRA
jgi:hypothetical protein